MLTFFRRIRKGLLGDGATSKYLLYAVGEIALVVIGILIALQINNWNEFKKGKTAELLVLSSLKEDLEANIRNIDYHLNKCHNQVKFLRSILNYSKIDESRISQEIKDTIRSVNNSYIEIVDGTVNSLLSTENINLVSNDTLKRLLTYYPARIKRIKKYEDRLFHIIDNRLRNTMEKYLSLTENIVQRDGQNSFHIYSDYTGLLKDHQYFNDVTNAMFSYHGLGRMSKDFMIETKNVLELVYKEIGKFNTQ